MLEVSHNEVKYQLETRDHDLYGYGVDVFMMDSDGTRPRDPIAFVPGQDEKSALAQTRQWLKIAFPAEFKGKKK